MFEERFDPYGQQVARNRGDERRRYLRWNHGGPSGPALPSELIPIIVPAYAISVKDVVT
jgi:hypothetical protein